MSDATTDTPRREFLRMLGRHAAAGGLLAGTGFLVLGKSDGASTARPCPQIPACAGCAVLTGCALPQAVAARTAAKGARDA